MVLPALSRPRMRMRISFFVQMSLVKRESAPPMMYMSVAPQGPPDGGTLSVLGVLFNACAANGVSGLETLIQERRMCALGSNESRIGAVDPKDLSM